MVKRKTMIIYRAPVMCFILHGDILLPKLEVHIIVPVLQIRRLRLKASKWLAQVTPTRLELRIIELQISAPSTIQCYLSLLPPLQRAESLYEHES